MSVYLLFFVWLGTVFILSQFINMYKEEKVLGVEKRRMKWIAAMITILPFIYWAGTRGYVGDTGAYLKTFESMPILHSFSDISSYAATLTKDKGFYIFAAIIKTIFGYRNVVYLTIIAGIQSVLLFSVWRKYSTNFLLSVFIFVASTDYISWMFNGVRQFMAVTIVFAGATLLFKKKYVPLIILILFASLFHQTALLMIPVVFIVQGEAWNKKTIVLLCAVIIAVLFIDSFTDILNSMLKETQYKNVVSDWQAWEDNGTNPIRVLVYSIPTILSLIGLKIIRKENNPVINISCNMSIIATGIYVLSIFTSGIFIGRLPIYCSLYSMGILLPWEIEHMFTRDSSKLIMILLVLFYIIFYYYQMHIIWGFF